MLSAIRMDLIYRFGIITLSKSIPLWKTEIIHEFQMNQFNYTGKKIPHSKGD